MEPVQGSCRWQLPRGPNSASQARQHVASSCAHLGRELRDVAVLLTSELVGNAVEHTDGGVELVVDRLPSRLRVEVRDESPVTPRPQHGGAALAPRGRGLMLVERLAASWGVLPDPPRGKRVWFELTLPGGST